MCSVLLEQRRVTYPSTPEDVLTVTDSNRLYIHIRPKENSLLKKIETYLAFNKTNLIEMFYTFFFSQSVPKGLIVILTHPNYLENLLFVGI